MKILFAGTPANAARTLSWLLEHEFEVVGVLTRPDAAVGRKKVLTPSPVAQIAQSAGLSVFKANRVDEDLAEALSATGADLGVVVAYGALLKDFALRSLPLGWVNLHYSLLPDWRGAAPVQNSIMSGDDVTGVTLFQLDSGMDTGPIYSAVPTQINPAETAGDLLTRLTELGNTLLGQTLPAIAAGIAVPMPQQSGTLARAATKIFREQARIDWSQPALRVERHVLGLNPEPMAYTVLNDQPIRVLHARALRLESLGLDQSKPKPDGSGAVGIEAAGPGRQNTNSAGSIGEVSVAKQQVLVTCGGGTQLELIQVQPSGKNPMAASDWVRGLGGKPVIFELGINERKI